jgi:hypothetical protein
LIALAFFPLLGAIVTLLLKSSTGKKGN